MMRRGLLAAILLVVAVVAAKAQVQVSTQTARSIFLLYERVDVIVTLTNIGGTDLELNNDEGRPWLSFSVLGEGEEHNFLPVHSERQSNFAAMTLKAGATKTLRVNITPLYEMRSEGNYRVSAVIDLPGEGEVMSDPTGFSIQRGHTVVSNLRTVDTLERIYSLVRFSPDAQDTSLYLRVEAPSENTVYANFALGPLVSSVDPAMLFDPQGNVHVLQPLALGTYLYTRTDPDGKVITQRLFKTFEQVRPRLIKINDGSVFVSGGLEEDPNAPHEKLSDSQHGQKIMAPVAPDEQVQQHENRAQPAAPDAIDSAPPPAGDPGESRATPAPAPAPAPNNPSSTDMPPAGP
jgi:hypothetical protein